MNFQKYVNCKQFIPRSVLMKRIIYKFLLPLLFTILIVMLTGCMKDSPVQEKVIGFPKITDPFNADEAINNGDVVYVNGESFNTKKWRRFLRDLNREVPYKVRITQYSIEGAPIYYELTYDGTLIHYTYDNSKDIYGGPDAGRQSTSCKGINTMKTEDSHEGYVLTECDNSKIRNTFWMDKN
jgi:hypothetical protein